MIECKGPKARRKGRAKEHGTNGITDGLVSAFDRTILMGQIGTGGVDSIVEFFEERYNERVVVELTTLVKDNIFVFNIR